MTKFWCCYVEGTGGFCKKHVNYGEAQVEAERLARKEGKVVYILEAIRYGYVQTPRVFFQDLREV